VPLPLKLFLSYMLVLAVFAIPVFVYLDARVRNDALAGREHDLQASVSRLGEHWVRSMGSAPDRRSFLVAGAQQMAAMTIDRVTVVSNSGDVWFDSSFERISNHGDRPEIRAAKANDVLATPVTANRTSASTGQQTIYAAVRIDDEGTVLRLARVADAHGGVSVRQFERNLVAVAVSVALLLSTLAAFMFVRPLRRVKRMAESLAQGDLLTRVELDSNDEVGDVGRALDQMAWALRRQLANAGSADAVVAQLIDALPHPCAVFELPAPPQPISVMAVNPAARRSVFAAMEPRVRLQLWSDTAPFSQAVVTAERDGDPEPLTLDVEGKPFAARLHLLKRPGAVPLILLVGDQRAPTTMTSIPPSGEIRTRLIADLVAEGSARAKKTWRLGVPCEARVPDLNGRIVDAFQDLANAFGDADIEVAVEGVEVRCRLARGLDDHTARRVAERIAMLGGRVDAQARETLLWLPIA
jgi:HAMP domain-containing protein